MLRRLSHGHLLVPIQLAGQSIEGVFDTGADATVVNLSFVRGHESAFKLLRSEEGTDGHSGAKLASFVYQVSSVQLGGQVLADAEVVAFAFGDEMQKGMEGVPIIIGTNLIGTSSWTFAPAASWWCSN